MRHTITILSLGLLPFLAFTQNGTVRGNVFDKETAQPLSFATVQVQGENRGTTTDINGFYSIPNITVGNHKLVVSYLGYDSVMVEVTIKKGEIIYQTINLSESGNKLGEIVISGKKAQAKSEVQISKLSVTPKQIRSLPSAGGQPDIAQYLTVLPGVIFTGDQGGQLYIRGGSPVQNRILLDGMTIYNPFHSIGFFSVFETEIIRNVDVLTGGFNADYGGRISAVVDVKTREGNRKRLSGLVSASPFQAKALIEGPIIPLKSDNGSSISFILTGKKALISQFDSQLYPYVNRENKTGIPFDYKDVYGKVSLMTGNGSKINFFGFDYTDHVSFPITDFSWKSGGGGLDFSLIPSNSSTIIDGKFTFSKYDSRIDESDRKPRSSGISGYYGALNFTNFARNSEFRYGIELTGFQTTFNFTNYKGITIDQDQNTTEINGYLKGKYKFGGFVVEPGFRIQYYQSLGDVSYEPRLGMKYNITDKIRVKTAGGLYSQNLLSTINERDVVNLFVGFLSGPDESIYQKGSKTKYTGNKLQKAWHGVFGFEFDLADNIDLNVEGYYKKFTQLISLNRFKQQLADKNYFVETGDAKGIDVTLKYEGKHSYVWLAYSLGKVTRDDGNQVYPPVFDRRHNLNVVATYQLGKFKHPYEFGVRWNLGSGFPFTQTQGFYTNYQLGGVGDDITAGNADLGIIYSTKRNGGRLPYYHRMDVSIKKMFELTKRARLEITASCTNVYDRPNIFYFDRVRYNRVNQLPIIPSLSATFQF
jgi:hypothetical protein